MGNLIQMDGLSQGAKPRGNDTEKLARRVPGGGVFDEGTGNKPSNVVNFPGGAKRDEETPNPIGESGSPPGSVSRNSGSPKGNERLSNFQNKMGGMAQKMKPVKQKALQKKLKQLQKAAPEMSKKLSGGAYKAAASLALDLAKQIQPLNDWFFLFILFPAAALKDIFDIVFTAAFGVSIIVSFIGSIFITILTIVALLLAGSDIKNRGLAKYFAAMILGFIADSIPGLDLLPLALAEAILVYGFTLFDRLMDHYAAKSEGRDSDQSESSAPEAQTANISQYPDSYPDRKAA